MKELILAALPVFAIVTYEPDDKGPRTDNYWVCDFASYEVCDNKQCNSVSTRGPLIVHPKGFSVSRCKQPANQCDPIRVSLKSHSNRSIFEAYAISPSTYVVEIDHNLRFFEHTTFESGRATGKGICREAILPPPILTVSK